jgi:phosphoenolpyruvate-protein kinase (PTS system EI component)
MALEKIGEGLSCSSKKEVTGEVAYVKTIEDVIALFDCATGKICIVDDAGITTLSPILSELAGTICTTGGPGSHLAIISREFGIPCIMALKMKLKDPAGLNGKNVLLKHDGDNRGLLYLYK